MRLFDEGTETIPLALVSSQTFSTGVIYSVYAPTTGPAAKGYDDAKNDLPRA